VLQVSTDCSARTTDPLGAEPRSSGVIEHRTIGPIPADERTGSARGLFGI
jgi:hypothetical protein